MVCLTARTHILTCISQQFSNSCLTSHCPCTKVVIDTRTIMKTRKRALSCASNAAPARGVPPQIEQRPPMCSTPCLAELKQNSFTTGTLPSSSAATLVLAVKAFQGQLEVCSKQPHSDLAGYRSFPQKQRLEHRTGDAALGDLGVLNHLANTVPVLTVIVTVMHKVTTHSYQCKYVTGGASHGFHC